MRTVLLGDIVALARALLAVPRKDQGALARRAISEAHVAHQVFKRLGSPHLQWGNGSLLGRASSLPQRREPFSDDPDYLFALGQVIEALLERQNCKTTNL